MPLSPARFSRFDNTEKGEEEIAGFPAKENT